MAIIKCKMCGGDIELSADKTFGTCKYCGTAMTLPKLDDEKRAAQFNRGNHFRRTGDFDKALAAYERIVQEDDTDAEAHWCCALCRFGIEYVEDPATMEYFPTCHRASFESFLEDVDYLAALKHSDGVANRQYQKEAAKIYEVQRGILATSQNEDPFDVFICYKETDDKTGERTQDSVDAQELYYALVQEGLRVFFARITLEDKAGTEYEPYIFAALNSAKVMVAIGSKPDYLNAVWVKNEWSRFLSLMKKDRSKLLLPCYKNMSPYELPEQLSVMQSYDMTKVGFTQDLIYGIRKVLGRSEAPQAVVVTQASEAAVAPLLDRAFLFIEDGKWADANAYCEKVLNQDPENARAYLGKLLAEYQVKSTEALKALPVPIDRSDSFRKASRFDATLAKELKQVNDAIRKRYEPAHNAKVYDEASRLLASSSIADVEKAAAMFRSIESWKDAKEKPKACEARIRQLRKEQAVQAQEQSKKKLRAVTVALIAGILVVLGIAAALLITKILIPNQRYNEAMELKAAGKYPEAIAAFEKLEGHKDSEAQIIDTEYLIALQTKDAGNYEQAIAEFEALNGYQDSAEQILYCKYRIAEGLAAKEDYKAAIDAFDALGDYSDAKERAFYLWGKLARWQTLAAGPGHTVAIREDGTAVTTGNNDYLACDVYGWEDLVSVSAGLNFTIGLKKDGTVIATGINDCGQCSVGTWSDIVAVSAGDCFTLGLKKDGTVVAAGDPSNFACNVSGWRDIIAISAGWGYSLGLKSDGTVVSVGTFDGYSYLDVGDWTDIVAICAGYTASAGLKKDGTVVSCGGEWVYDSIDVASWRNIVAISTSSGYVIGITADGQFLYTGHCGRAPITDFYSEGKIVAVSATQAHAIALLSDGTAAVGGYAGISSSGTDVSNFINIRLPEY